MQTTFADLELQIEELDKAHSEILHKQIKQEERIKRLEAIIQAAVERWEA